ncbi:hypothetical protein LINPERPRIM_LOCUS30856 [Linum perenne]
MSVSSTTLIPPLWSWLKKQRHGRVLSLWLWSGIRLGWRHRDRRRPLI